MTRGLALAPRQRLFHHLGEFAIDDEHLGFSVIERERENGGVEARVQRVEHRAAHRYAVVRLNHCRRIGEHDRDSVAALDAAARQRRRQLPGARIELPVVPGPRAVHDCGLVRIDRRSALKERKRRQRLEIRRVALEVGVVSRHGRSLLPTLSVAKEGRLDQWRRLDLWRRIGRIRREAAATAPIPYRFSF